MREAAITGFGVFSAFGRGPDALFDSVFAGKHGFRRVSRFALGQHRADHAAHADTSPALAATFADVTADALAMAGMDAPDDAAILLGTQGDWTGLTRYWDEPDTDLLPTAAGVHPALLAASAGITRGRRRTFVNGCVASADSIAQGAKLIELGRADTVIAGGGYLVDAEFFARFDSGRAITVDPPMRPFSLDRTGLLLGDGVAVVVLEALDTARARGARPLATVDGWGMASDAYHVCRPDPEGSGMSRAIAAALRRARLDPADVGYVNAHGTATAVNDPAETLALRRVFGSACPPVSSTKSTTGHALEGSGALEAVICLLALREGLLPPTANFTEPDPTCELDCIPEGPRAARVDAVVSVNAAFGGANAALVLRRAS
ncbi:beta-ketoacyl-[acyl-carrier-protein] synthase family protein [Actinokineospora sp.]|uniref:beta-ketoacyl-[acyl-carrier-protein] synthase family protein n=1 Tax=Actinokineospora sp. TaxID=1872133 RepID=UPI00403821B3